MGPRKIVPRPAGGPRHAHERPRRQRRTPGAAGLPGPAAGRGPLRRLRADRGAGPADQHGEQPEHRGPGQAPGRGREGLDGPGPRRRRRPIRATTGPTWPRSSWAPDESLAGVLDLYRPPRPGPTPPWPRVDDLGRAVPLPSGVPWFPEGATVRWVLLHLVEETARHAGHADIIRESLDGAQAGSLMAAAENWEPSPWVTPWTPASMRRAGGLRPGRPAAGRRGGPDRRRPVDPAHAGPLGRAGATTSRRCGRSSSTTPMTTPGSPTCWPAGPWRRRAGRSSTAISWATTPGATSPGSSRRPVPPPAETLDLEATVHCSFGDFTVAEYFWQINSFRGLAAHDFALVIGVDPDLPEALVQGCGTRSVPTPRSGVPSGSSPPPWPWPARHRFRTACSGSPAGTPEGPRGCPSSGALQFEAGQRR